MEERVRFLSRTETCLLDQGTVEPRGSTRGVCVHRIIQMTDSCFGMKLYYIYKQIYMKHIYMKEGRNE